MPALLKFLVLIAIFLLASYANAFSSPTPVAGNQVQENQWFQFVEPVSKPMNEPTVKPTKQTELPNIFTSDTSEMSNPTINQDREGEEHSETVSNVESSHNTIRVSSKQVTFSDEQDDEIQSKSPVECNSRPNEWQMPDKIDLDSSGLRCSARSAVVSWRDKIYSHSMTVL